MAIDTRATTVGIPWAAYWGDTTMNLTFPAEWDVRAYPSTDGADIGETGIAAAFEAPIGSSRIREIARGKRSAVIVVDDLSRPTPAERVIPHILRELAAAGIAESDTTVICGVANHRQMTREDMVKKCGADVVERLKVVNHFSWDRCDYIGTTRRGMRVSLNRDFLAAEVKILVGGLFPHGTPGFGGGAKLVVPGVASIDTCYDLHGPHGPKTGLNLDASEARLEMEEAARMAGVDAIVNTIPTSRRGIADMVVGDVVDAHREGVRRARRIFATPVPRDKDIVVLNAFPKDSEYLQISMAFNVWQTASAPPAREGGSVVVCSAASEGWGFHSLIGPGRRVNTTGSFPVRLVGNRDAFVFAPGIGAQDLTPAALEGISLSRDWDLVVEGLRAKHGARASVAVFPWSAIQLADGVAD
jgi:nickel-dependent lactate racemase